MSRFLAGVCAAAVLALPNVLRAYEYELEGEVRASQKMLKGANGFQTVRFHVYVRDCAWLIHAVPEGHGFASYWEIASDGNCYYRLGVSKPGAGKEACLAGVENGPVPEFISAPQIAVIWLAAASSCYLDAAGNTLLPPYSRDRTRVPHHAVVSRRTSEPRLPEQICLLADGFSDPGRYPAPYDKGFTNAMFRALSFTNIAGLDLPTAFSYEDFLPDESILRTGFECAGTISAIRSGCTLSNLLPGIPSGLDVRIRDFRFQSPHDLQGHDFQYRSASWLTRSQAAQLPGYTNYLAWEQGVKSIPKALPSPAPATRPPSRPARLVVVALLCVSTVVLLSLWRLTPKRRAT